MFVRLIASAAVVGLSALATTTSAGAACATGTAPTTQYVGTVVGRLADDQFHLKLDDGRVVLLQVAARHTEDGFGGSQPLVGHRYRVRGAVDGTGAIGLSGCVAGSQLVDLGVAPGSSNHGTGPIAVAVTAVVVALLCAAGFVAFRRRAREAHARSAQDGDVDRG